MRTPRLFSDQPLLVSTEVVLEGSAAQYLGKVLRARVGDSVILFDGQGQQGTATIKAIAKHSVSAQLDTITTPQTESSLRSHPDPDPDPHPHSHVHPDLNLQRNSGR